MVMKANSRSTPGVIQYTAIRCPGSPNPVTSTVSFQTQPVSRKVVLDNVVSVNNKTLRPESIHSYRKTDVQGWLGSKTVRVTNTVGYINDDTHAGAIGSAEGIAFPEGWLNYQAEAYNLALADLYEKARGNLDMSIDLLQAKQTKQMFHQWVKGINYTAKTIRALKKAPLRSLAGLHLQYTYGVKPTLSSIYELGRLIQKESYEPMWITGKARVAKITKYDLTSVQSFPGKGFVSLDRSEICKIRAQYRRPQQLSADLASFTSLNPASIALELTPFSFVLDWFYDVGGYLRTLESSYVLRPYLSGCVVSRVSRGELFGAFSGSSVTNAGGQTMEARFRATLGGGYTMFNRSGTTALSPPSIPTPNLQLGVQRRLNGLALLVGQTSSIDNTLKRLWRKG